MKLRNLELKDAPLMLEWMHDETVVEKMRGRFAEKSIKDCESFIKNSWNKEKDIHLAIVSDEDEYMGTVSLKNIDIKNGSAEFAITVRKSAMGRDFSWWGMKEILKIAFEQYDFEIVYWCVSRENERAIRFYNKHDFKEITDISDEIMNRYKEMDNLKWYAVSKKSFCDYKAVWK